MFKCQKRSFLNGHLLHNYVLNFYKELWMHVVDHASEF